MINRVWKIPKKLEKTIDEVSKVYKMKHGMFAGVPIICKGEECPYKKSCLLENEEIEVGSRCAMEAAAIIARFESWCDHFGIDVTKDEIKSVDVVDVSLIKDLVDNEIQTLRAENRIAITADFIERNIANIDKQGRIYYENVVSPEANFKLQLMDKRHKILQLLNSTRKDKSKQLNGKDSASVKALGILKKVGEMLPDNLDNLDFKDEGVE